VRRSDGETARRGEWARVAEERRSRGAEVMED